jgi:beta-glucosidase
VLGTTPTGGRLEYTEGLAVGHRAYLAAGTEPAYWFGAGLGYTSWEYEGISAPEEAGAEGCTAVVRLRNTGERRGKQVVQVYASRPDAAAGRPARWLAGFAVLHADPGQRVEAAVEIGPRALRHWDDRRHAWAVEPGEVVLATGPSAGDLRARTSVVLRDPGIRA